MQMSTSNMLLCAYAHGETIANLISIVQHIMCLVTNVIMDDWGAESAQQIACPDNDAGCRIQLASGSVSVADRIHADKQKRNVPQHASQLSDKCIC